jgi:peptide/nickel transport system substrate-binding protein
VHVGTGPSAIAIGADSVWVACELDGTVWRIDRHSGVRKALISVGNGPAAITVAKGSVWVANRYSGTVARINPGTNGVERIFVGGEPVGIAAARHKIWEASERHVQHRGGTLRLLHSNLLTDTVSTIDPDLDVDLLPLQADSLTADGLVTYRVVSGGAGTQLVPDLALTVPEATDGDTTYTFLLRRDEQYSDGRTVRASDFRRSFERLFSLRHPRAYAAVYFTDIVGAEACDAARAGRCDLSRGIETNDALGTVTIHLRTPDRTFLQDLASRPLPPAPPGTPFHAIGFTPIPGTGPYEIASASPHEIRYVRNPYFHAWSDAAQPDGNPDQIVMRFGLSFAAEIRAVEKGRADYSTDPIPIGMLPYLESRFPGQLHPGTIPTTAFYALNTRLPPFDDVRVRQALNYAIDRGLLVRLFGGREQAMPTCQVLPPEVPGYERNCPYTRNPRPGGRWTAPDLPKAEQLVAASRTRGAIVRIAHATDANNAGVENYIARVLRVLGYRVRYRSAPFAYFQAHPAVFKHMQMTQVGLGDTPYSYFATWFTCGPQSSLRWFCDGRIASENNRAASLMSTNPRAAENAWAAIDRQLVARAAWLPLVDLKGINFVSARVRNYQFQPYSGVIADQLWLRTARR